MKPLDFHPEAVAEADQAFDWYADHGLHVAMEFKAALHELLDQICLMPGRFPRYVFNTQKAVFRKYPYLIVFRERKDDIQVVAVAHGRRRFGYWAPRL
jgi:plasmid stabilization system protein ParE